MHVPDIDMTHHMRAEIQFLDSFSDLLLAGSDGERVVVSGGGAGEGSVQEAKDPLAGLAAKRHRQLPQMVR